MVNQGRKNQCCKQIWGIKSKNDQNHCWKIIAGVVINATNVVGRRIHIGGFCITCPLWLGLNWTMVILSNLKEREKRQRTTGAVVLAKRCGPQKTVGFDMIWQAFWPKTNEKRPSGCMTHRLFHIPAPKLQDVCGRGLVLMDPPYEPYDEYMAWNLYSLRQSDLISETSHYWSQHFRFKDLQLYFLFPHQLAALPLNYQPVHLWAFHFVEALVSCLASILCCRFLARH